MALYVGKNGERVRARPDSPAARDMETRGTHKLQKEPKGKTAARSSTTADPADTPADR